MNMPKVIDNAATVKESQRMVADGIIHSAMLTSFQRQAIDGIIGSAMPEKKAPEVKMLTPVRAAATKQDIGYVHYPGSKYR